MVLANSYGPDNISFHDGDSILGSTRKSGVIEHGRSPPGMFGAGGVVADSFGSVSDVEAGRAAENANGLAYNNMDNIPMDTSFTNVATNRQSLGQSGLGAGEGGFDDDFGGDDFGVRSHRRLQGQVLRWLTDEGSAFVVACGALRLG